MSSEEINQIEKLKDSANFQMWRFQITIIFKSYGVYDIVEGGRKYPDGAEEKLKKDWESKDAKAQKCIITTIDRQPLTHILTCKTAHDMFLKLCTIYERDTEQQKYVLLQEFFNYNFQKESDMATHISKLENLVYRLNSVKQEIDETMLITKILTTLPSKYKHFISAWDSTVAAEKNLTNLTARLLAEESRVNSSDLKEEQVAFKSIVQNSTKNYSASSTSKNYKTNVVCFKCNRPGHIARMCEKNKMIRKVMKCNICKKTNHLEKDCFFRRNDNENNRKVSFLIDNNNKTNQWIVDSGSSSHMVNSVTQLKDMRDVNSEIGTAKKSISMKAEGIGVVEAKDCTLKEVVYVPELSKNLLSVNAITRNNGEVRFKNNKVEIFKNKKKIVEGEKDENGLYVVNLTQDIQDTNLNVLMTKEDNALVWHRKLGHLGSTNMKKLVNISDGMNLTGKDFKILDNICETCLKAKQTRKPFKEERNRASRPLELIHSDVCGPIEPTTWDGSKYFITFLDDYTHFTSVYLMKGKYEVAEIVKEFVIQNEVKWNLKVHKLRCDNGGEYVNSNLQNWCKEKGVILDYTVPYSPQLNGKAERLNRTLMDRARALIFDTKENKTMWGEAIRVAAYLTNRSPSDTIDVTPVEKWTLRKPNLSNLQVFGCNAYAKVLGQTKKLDERSRKYIFVGYAPNGYRLWDERKRKVIIARDVVFEEQEIKMKENTEENIDENINMGFMEAELPEYEHEEKEDEEESEQMIDIEDNIEVPNENRGENCIPRKREIKLPKKFDDYVLLTYQEAISGPDRDCWLKAIDEEKNSLEENKTWKLVNESEVKDKKILSNKWIFKIKEDGRYKARLVVRGCEQIYGMDFNETFSPVISSSSLRLVFALAAKRNAYVMKFDIKTAFLYGILNEDLYMKVPEGFEENNKVCKLEKALYGLKQAPMQWNECFKNFLEQNDLIPTKSEQCIYRTNDSSMILAIYVDDGILIGNNNDKMKDLLLKLKEKYKITICKNVNTFLGIEIDQKPGTIEISQSNFVSEILNTFRMTECKPAITPLAIDKTRNENVEPNTTFPYREAVGSLLYLANKTRPDLAYSVNYVSRYMENPTNCDVANVKRILRYLQGNKELGIQYKSENSNDMKGLVAFCDSDYAGDTDTRRSTTGFVIMYCGGPIAWCSRKQPIVALSTTEAEYIAAAECCKEVLYLKTLIEEVTYESVPVNINIDNQSAIQLIKNGIVNRRSKHIDVRFHFINEKYKEGIIQLSYCPSSEQVADMFTKILAQNKFEKHRNVILNCKSRNKL